jgi:hypothetical protein
MSDRYRDFDAFFAEQQREPVKLKLFGEVHELPPSLPAVVVLKMIRMQKEHGSMARVPHADLTEMAVAIFGEERFDQWCKQGLDVDMLAELIKWTMQEYMGRNQGNGKAPKKGQRNATS